MKSSFTLILLVTATIMIFSIITRDSFIFDIIILFAEILVNVVKGFIQIIIDLILI